MADLEIVKLGQDIREDAADLWAMHQPPGLDGLWRDELGEFSLFCSTRWPEEIRHRVAAEFGECAPKLGCVALLDSVPVGIARASLGKLRGVEQQHGLEDALGFSWAVLPRARQEGVGYRLAEAMVEITTQAVNSRGGRHFNRPAYAVIDMADDTNAKIAERAGLKPLSTFRRQVPGSGQKISTRLWALPMSR